MKSHRASGFTIAELIIVIAVIGILAAIAIVAYNGVQKRAAEKSIQNDLTTAASEMQYAYVHNNNVYPTTLPSSFQPSSNTSITVKGATSYNYYGSSLSTVQNGVLLSQICQDLINEGAGKGTDQGGTVRDYITGCGNWNNDSMQITGWDSKKFTTPLSSATLISYADSYTVSNTFHKAAQEGAVKNFYRQLVARQTIQGGSFPITSFWDYWATPSNGGVQLQPLPTPTPKPYFCLEGTNAQYSDLKWHITDSDPLTTGGCY